jgi:hypothetical protein
MADNWTKLGDTVAELVRLHSAAERDERGYREELLRLTETNRRQARQLAELGAENRRLARENVRLQNGVK